GLWRRRDSEAEHQEEQARRAAFEKGRATGRQVILRGRGAVLPRHSPDPRGARTIHRL
ncbi:MAG: hypothetical protein AVDCRST_MAG28-389, partial [uncultured Rubrobacteraceae bacterium]